MLKKFSLGVIMSVKLDEFKEFVKKHPLMKLQVLNKEKTWQKLKYVR